MKLSIICLCYNQEKSIIKLIKSIKYADIDCEIIIIDDCSSDNSIQAINSFSFEKVKLIKLDKNLNNQSYSRNLGIKNSTGDYILFMDGDDYYNSWELKQLYNTLNNQNIIALKSLHIDTVPYQTQLEFKDQEIYHSITMFCLKKEFLIKNGVYWDEEKYYVDGEDFYYTFWILCLYTKIHYSKYCPSIITKRPNSNTHKKYKRKDYPNYIEQMCTDVIFDCIDFNRADLIKYVVMYKENEIKRWLSANRNALS